MGIILTHYNEHGLNMLSQSHIHHPGAVNTHPAPNFLRNAGFIEFELEMYSSSCFKVN